MNQVDTTAFQPKLPISDDPKKSYTLPSSMYIDPAAFQLEKQTIFYREWHYIGHVSQFSNTGDFRTIQIADESVFVIRGSDGELRGFYNVCKHRAHHLMEGHGNRKNIVCPYHAWSYSHTGSLIHAPNSENMAGFDKSANCLSSIRVEQFCNLVFVNLDPEAESLAARAPDLQADIEKHIPGYDQLEVSDSIVFGPSAIAANWKVVIDNYVECYHCSVSHRDFVSLIDMSQYQMDTSGIWSRQLGPKVNPQNSAYPFDADAAVQHSVFWYLWPTTAIAMLPGKPNMQVYAMLPDGAEHTTFAGDWLSLDPADAQGPVRDYMNDVLGPEDTALCESVQKGLRSQSYDQGKLIVDAGQSGIAEHAVHHFHRLVLDALDGSSEG